MKKFSLFIAFASISVFIFYSCQKDSAALQKQNFNSSVNLSSTVIGSCPGFSYGDSLFLLAYPVTDSFISPISPQPGEYGCFPNGLSINPQTGVINLYQSETGLRYMVWFKAVGGTDTCQTFITLSGINYMDSIYTFSKNQVLASPIYNATRQNEPECRHGDCEYDDGHDDDNGDGFDDEPPVGQEVIPQGIVIDKLTGNIDLQQSITNGALGSNPQPGTFKDFNLYYRISDGSQKALNRIAFRLYYYQTRSQIPKSLLKTYRQKRNLILFNDIAPQFNLMQYIPASETSRGTKEPKCRPPYIIIVQG